MEQFCENKFEYETFIDRSGKHFYNLNIKDDLICAFDSGFDSASNNLESIIFLLLGWVVLAFFVYVIVYRLFKTNQTNRDDQVAVDEPDLKKEELQEKEELIKKVELEKEKSPVKEIISSIPLPVLKVKPKTGKLLSVRSHSFLMRGSSKRT